MPGGHSENTKLIGFWCDGDFLSEIDRARGAIGRSQFLRDALVDYLRRSGFDVPIEKTVAPDRAGKGGPRRRTVKPIDRSMIVSDQSETVAKESQKLREFGTDFMKGASDASSTSVFPAESGTKSLASILPLKAHETSVSVDGPNVRASVPKRLNQTRRSAPPKPPARAPK